MDKKGEIILNSEDEDYDDLPSCGTTGDPAHKVKSKKGCDSSKKEKGCCKSCDCECRDCDCAKKGEEEKKVEEPEGDKKDKKICYKCKEAAP